MATRRELKKIEAEDIINLSDFIYQTQIIELRIKNRALVNDNYRLNAEIYELRKQLELKKVDIRSNEDDTKTLESLKSDYKDMVAAMYTKYGIDQETEMIDMHKYVVVKKGGNG